MDNQNQTLPARMSDQKFCHSCAKALHLSATLCPSCGATQLPSNNHLTQPGMPGNVAHASIASAIYCRGCGHAIHASTTACPHCGAQQESAANSSGAKSRITAALFAFFLGAFGGHKFYCGKPGLGILYLLFFWTYIPAIIALIEGVLYLSCNDDAAFTKKYCA